MQKKIIALAIAAAFAAPTAFAETSNVTVYGIANVSYDVVNTSGNAAGTLKSFSNKKISSNTSRIGLKGSEDLGDGLSAIWQVESLVAIDNAGGTFGTRNTFAGLSSATAGTVLLGRHDTPYNIASRSMDLFADGLADNRSLMGGATLNLANLGGSSAGASFDGRQPDVLAYISPAMSGFTGAIAYVAGAEAATGASAKGGAWSLAGLYGNGPLTANFGYEFHKLGSVGTGTVAAPIGLPTAVGLKESAWKLAVGYKMDALVLNAVYEKTTDNFGTAVGLLGQDLLGHRTIYLSGKYSINANDAVKLAYTNHGDRNATVFGALGSGATQVSVGYDHSLSKRTTVYALYTKLSNDTGSSFALSGNGTGGGISTTNGAGASPSAISLGMKHTF